MKKEDYVDSVSIGLNDRRIREEVRDELRAHIDDSIDDLVRQGHPPEEAEDIAVSNMGDPDETAALFNEVHKPFFEWKQIIGLSVLSLILYYPITIAFFYTAGPFAGSDNAVFGTPLGTAIRAVLGGILVVYALIVLAVERYLDLPFWYGRSQNGGSNANGAIVGAIGISIMASSFRALIALLAATLCIMIFERNLIESKRLQKERRFIFRKGVAATDLGSADVDDMHYSSKEYREFSFPGKADFNGTVEKVIARKFIPAGSEITVIGIDGFRLKVE